MTKQPIWFFTSLSGVPKWIPFEVQHRAVINLAIRWINSLGWWKQTLEVVQTAQWMVGEPGDDCDQENCMGRQPIMRLPKVALHANLLSMGGRPPSPLSSAGEPNCPGMICQWCVDPGNGGRGQVSLNYLSIRICPQRKVEQPHSESWRRVREKFSILVKSEKCNALRIGFTSL